MSSTTSIGQPLTESGNDSIDLVHLSRQTLGDRMLELELLGLFEQQTAQIVATLGEPTDETAGRRHCDLAHLIKGSARAIGAFKLAAAAESYEDALRSGLVETMCEALRAAVCVAALEACEAARQIRIAASSPKEP